MSVLIYMLLGMFLVITSDNLKESEKLFLVIVLAVLRVYLEIYKDRIQRKNRRARAGRRLHDESEFDTIERRTDVYHSMRWDIAEAAAEYVRYQGEGNTTNYQDTGIFSKLLAIGSEEESAYLERTPYGDIRYCDLFLDPSEYEILKPYLVELVSNHESKKERL